MSAPGLAEKEVRAEVFVAYSNLSTVRDEQRPQLLHGFLNNKFDASWRLGPCAGLCSKAAPK